MGFAVVDVLSVSGATRPTVKEDCLHKKIHCITNFMDFSPNSMTSQILESKETIISIINSM